MSEDKEKTQRSGGCLCGAVRYTARFGRGFAACYCKMCQRWASGAFMGISAEDFELSQGHEQLEVYKSSDWAQRAFCRRCGSNIYYHAANFGAQSIAMGSLDDVSGLKVKVQYFIDQKPEGFTLAESTREMTSADIEAVFKQT